MTSRAERKRRKKARQYQQAPDTVETAVMTLSEVKTAPSTRPTAERRRHGVWAKPTGADKRSQPMVDLASDMIGALYQAKQITTSQEQAARLFQELRAGYLAELGTKGFGSCLADNQTGYDGGDGNAAIIAAYRSLERKVGRYYTSRLTFECEKSAGMTPMNINVLKSALNAVAGA